MSADVGKVIEEFSKGFVMLKEETSMISEIRKLSDETQNSSIHIMKALEYIEPNIL